MRSRRPVSSLVIEPKAVTNFSTPFQGHAFGAPGRPALAGFACVNSGAACRSLLGGSPTGAVPPLGREQRRGHACNPLCYVAYVYVADDVRETIRKHTTITPTTVSWPPIQFFTAKIEGSSDLGSCLSIE